MNKRKQSQQNRKAGRKGGFVRAAKLSKKRRSEIARIAVQARWAKWRAENPDKAGFRVGDRVVIARRRTRLIHALTDVKGGWIVDPPVLNIRFWNEQEMRRMPR